MYFRGLRRERMLSVQTLKVEETGPGFGWISPDRNRASRMTSEVDGIRRMGDQDAVKKNDMGMMLNKPNSVVAVAWFEDLEGEIEEWYLASRQHYRECKSIYHISAECRLISINSNLVTISSLQQRVIKYKPSNYGALLFNNSIDFLSSTYTFLQSYSKFFRHSNWPQ